MVRLAGLVWTPRGLTGPKYAGSGLLGVRWGDLSRWQHLGRPGGPPAACRRRGHVRFPLVGAWGAKFSRSVQAMPLVPFDGACHAPFSGRKKPVCTDLESRDLRGRSASSPRPKPANRWSPAPPPAALIGGGWFGVLGHFTGSLMSTRTAFFAISRDVPCSLTTRRRACCLLAAGVVISSGWR